MSLLQPKKIYLAGGIHGLSELQAAEWRGYAAEMFMLHSMEVIDPLRGRRPVNGSYDGSVYTPAEIVLRDKNDILAADAVLAEYTDTNRNYAGTSMEILFAYEHLKPVVVWSKHADSYWLRYHATVILPTLDECIEFLANYW